MTAVADDALPLQRLLHWETTAPGRIAFTQPMGGGRVRDFTWAEVAGEVRRIAAYLKAQGFPPGSRIAILSKNCAHWMMSDFAIWLAGHVSVPLYPTLAPGTIRQILEHSETRLLFVGKLDGWERHALGRAGGAAMRELPAVAAQRLPLVGPHRARHIAAAGRAAAPGRRDVDHHVHVGHDRQPQGRDAQLRHVHVVAGHRASAASRFAAPTAS